MFGSTFWVRETTTGNLYAVKKLPRTKLAQSSEEAPFAFYEIQLLSLTDHKKCISLKSVFEDSLNLYIVTNHYAGIDLLSAVVIERKLTLERSVRYSQQLLQVLAALESQRIIHHGIKPQNLIFSD